MTLRLLGGLAAGFLALDRGAALAVCALLPWAVFLVRERPSPPAHQSSSIVSP